MTQFSFIPSGEARELADDVQELFADLAAHLEHHQRAYSGECRPPLDVFETDAAIEVVVDLSGVPPDAIRVLFRSGMLLVAGEKAPPRSTAEHTFHLVEREFGRFVRAVRLTGAFDVERARASVADGELTVVLPKREERRDRAHRIALTDGQPG